MPETAFKDTYEQEDMFYRVPMLRSEINILRRDVDTLKNDNAELKRDISSLNQTLPSSNGMSAFYRMMFQKVNLTLRI